MPTDSSVVFHFERTIRIRVALNASAVLPGEHFHPQAPRLASKLVSDASDEGLGLEDLETKSGEVEDYIRDIIVHVGEPGMAGD